MTDVVTLLHRAKAELEDRRLEIERLRALLDGRSGPRRQRIAVIGTAMRLPGAIASMDDLWRSLLASSVHARAISSHRNYSASGFWRRAEAYTSRVSMIDDPWGFDHKFFRISPQELRRIDPQHRLLLEMAWEALENAAIPPHGGSARRGGVFIGISSDDFQRLQRVSCVPEGLDAYAGTGAHRSMAAGRLAAFLGWNGPAIQLDTACSSSLVAIHLACQALRNGDIDIALSGGCQLILDPASVIERGALGALASDGRCKPFEDAADGFGMGEGGALVVLRSYEAAVRDGDPIIAVIDGVAVNHNGSGAGITVPNPAAQVAVMRAALSDSGANADEIVFLEAHATGTKLGDPIEASAIETVYGARQHKLPLGSIKANFGHLEAAAGVVSLLKAILVHRHRVVPPTPNLRRDSGYIPWGDMMAYVPRQTQSLVRRDQDDRVAVSSFGMSGTNCHIILSAASDRVSGDAANGGALPILISAADPVVLATMASQLAVQVESGSIEMADISRTLATGRTHFDHRVGFVVSSPSELLTGLRAVAQGITPSHGFASHVLSGSHARVRILIGGRLTMRPGGSPTTILSTLLKHPKEFRPTSSQGSILCGSYEEATHAAYAAFWGTLVPSCEASRPGQADAVASGHGTPGVSEPDILAIDFAEMLHRAAAKHEESFECAVQSAVAEALAALFCANAPVAWEALSYNQGRRQPLPTYPFRRSGPGTAASNPFPPASLSQRSVHGGRLSMTPNVHSISSSSHPSGGVLGLLTAKVAALLELPISEVAADKALLELGADSIMLAELVRYIGQELGVPVELRALFEGAQTINSLVTLVGPTARVTTAPPATSVVAVMTDPDPSLSLEPQRAKAAPYLVEVGSPPRARHSPSDVRRFQPNYPTTTNARAVMPPSLEDLARPIIERFLDRTPRSLALAKGGSLLVCNNRRSLSDQDPLIAPARYPIFAKSSRKAWIRDVDGNDYLDIAMGFGVHLFGHNPPFLTEALTMQIECGTHLGPEAPKVVELAGNIARLTGVERVLFCNTGTEAVMTAIRIARAAGTGDKVVMFRNSYHGHFDQALGIPAGSGSDPTAVKAMAPGMPESFYEDVVLLPYNSARSIKYIREHAAEIAGVVVEPVQNRRPDIDTTWFLRELRSCTREAGVLLIFDEVLIGFRLHPGGAQAYFGVDADIVTYGKIIGGGMPIGIVAGRADVLAVVDGGRSFWTPGDPPLINRIYTAGTFCKNPLTIAAGVATSTELLRQGNALQSQLNQRTEDFVRELNDRFAELDVPIKVYNTGSFFRFAQHGNLSFVYTPFEMELFFLAMANNGVYMSEGGTSFLSTAHTDDDIAGLIQAAVESARSIRDRGGWSGTSRDTIAQSKPLAESRSASSGRFADPLPKAGPHSVVMSHLQRSIWNAHHLDATLAAYSLRTSIDIKGRLSRAAVDQALAEIVDRHAALRARVIHCDRIAIEDASVTPSVQWVELGHLDHAHQKLAVESWFASDTKQAMDLTGGGALFRATVLSRADDHRTVVVTIHHLIGDGRSQAILAEELATLLAAKAAGVAAELAAPCNYFDSMRSRGVNVVGTTLHEVTQGEPSRHPSTGDVLRLRTYRGDRRRISLGMSYKTRINRSAAKLGATHYQFALACFLVAIARFFKTTLVTTGVSVTDRSSAEMSALIANCSYLHSVTVAVGEHRNIMPVIESVREQLLQAISAPARPATGGRTPTSCFNWDRYAPLSKQSLTIELLHDPSGATRFPFSLNVVETGSDLTLEWDYSTDVFSDADIVGLNENFVAVLDTETLDSGSNHVSLLAAFQATLAAYGDRRAVVDEAGAMTYREVGRAVETMAAAMVASGVVPGDIVAIALPPNRHALTALLATWRIGAAFVFLDSAAPVRWLDTLVTRSVCKLVIAECATAEAFSAAPTLDLDTSLASRSSALLPTVTPQPDAVAYLVFTSGTTGQAKAVPVTHGQLTDYSAAMYRQMNWHGGSFLQLSPMFVDLGYTLWTGALMAGGTLLLPGMIAARDPDLLGRFCAATSPDYAKLTPSHLAALLQMPGAESVLPRRALILGGEQLTTGLAGRIRALRPTLTIVNHYGPAEACIGVCTFVIRPEDSLPVGPVVPIGKALGDVRLLLERSGDDDSLAELILVGSRVGRGYWRQPEVDSRFEGSDAVLGRFRTGDLVGCTETGDLVFVCRQGDVIKWRGYRVNPTDIAVVASGVGSVLHARVAVVGDALRLSLLVGAAANMDDVRNRVVAHLAEALPPYMRPTIVDVARDFPLTPSGKLATDHCHTSAQSKSTKDQVLAIFRAVLGDSQIGADDNLFDICTDSLQYIRLLAEIRTVMGITVNLEQLFDHPTPNLLGDELGSTLDAYS